MTRKREEEKEKDRRRRGERRKKKKRKREEEEEKRKKGREKKKRKRKEKIFVAASGELFYVFQIYYFSMKNSLSLFSAPFFMQICNAQTFCRILWGKNGQI